MERCGQKGKVYKLLLSQEYPACTIRRSISWREWGGEELCLYQCYYRLQQCGLEEPLDEESDRYKWDRNVVARQ